MLGDAAALRELAAASCARSAGSPHPMLRRRGEPGFTRIGWDEALDLAAARIGAARPGARRGFYLTSRGMSNEAYYAAQKAVRAIGTNSIDNAARVCHSPSTVRAQGRRSASRATTCSYSDWIGTDLSSSSARTSPTTSR